MSMVCLSSSNPHPVKVPAALFPSTPPLYIDFYHIRPISPRRLLSVPVSPSTV